MPKWLTLVLLWAAAARADPTLPEMDAGRRLEDAGDHLGAVQQFEFAVSRLRIENDSSSWCPTSDDAYAEAELELGYSEFRAGLFLDAENDTLHGLDCDPSDAAAAMGYLNLGMIQDAWTHDHVAALVKYQMSCLYRVTTACQARLAAGVPIRTVEELFEAGIAISADGATLAVASQVHHGDTAVSFMPIDATQATNPADRHVVKSWGAEVDPDAKRSAGARLAAGGFQAVPRRPVDEREATLVIDEVEIHVAASAQDLSRKVEATWRGRTESVSVAHLISVSVVKSDRAAYVRLDSFNSGLPNKPGETIVLPISLR